MFAFSPLADPRAVNAIMNLRGRGFDVVVVEIVPTPLLPPARSKRDELAHRLWALSRTSRRETYRRAGIPVVQWSDDVSLTLKFEEVARSRRRARPIRT